ncbi:MAG: aryl-sulfate sulfotransferase [Candidatus Nanohaloarchaea archaeon]|nr:aryl-sulfate sulfotransferase [Candidatus Nanohaloarchaea archaeon]
MRTPSRNVQRAALLAVFLGAGLVVVNAYASGSTDTYPYADAAGTGEQVVPPRANATAVTTAEPGRLVLFGADGTVQYHDTSFDQYNDVDPLGDGRLLYVAANHSGPGDCPGTTLCTRIAIETVNTTSGRTERLYTTVNAGKTASAWHDVDRINGSLYAVADIAQDRVFVLNVSSGVVEWAWDAQQHFPLRGGGPFPGDWTHMNDVEVLPDGRLMASPRNQDQVVFLDRGGVQEEWTLGSEDDYSVLYEQHNPDFLPGGPSVIVADSQNDRVVEYRRVNGTWVQSWEWGGLAWPRDADRLPGCRTLVTDTNADRVIELGPDGETLWTADNLANVYDAERLGTGDESAGGRTADACGLPSRAAATGQDDTGSILRTSKAAITGLLPAKLVNAVKYVLPYWMDYPAALALATAVAALLALVVVELRRRVDVRLRWPVEVA